MKLQMAIICVIFVGLIGICYGQNLDQKFGIGSGIYLNDLKEVSISYGISNKTMMLFYIDVSYDHTDMDRDFTSDVTSTENSISKQFMVLGGPEVRGYFFANKRLSPFAGIKAAMGWAQDKNETDDGSWNKIKNFQLNFSLTYGAEYFVKSYFSLYACMSLFSYSLIRTENEAWQQSGGITTKITTNRHSLKFEQNPALFVRFYF